MQKHLLKATQAIMEKRNAEPRHMDEQIPIETQPMDLPIIVSNPKRLESQTRQPKEQIIKTNPPLNPNLTIPKVEEEWGNILWEALQNAKSIWITPKPSHS